MKKLLTILFFFPITVFAQYHQWEINLSGISGQSIVQTKDGGYAIGGTATSVCLTKLDSNGNIKWTSEVGGGNYNQANSMVQTKDGGYVLAGTTQKYGAGGMDVYVVKLDSAGNLQWTRTIGGPDDDWGNAITQTKDGGYAITGGTKSFGYGVPSLADIWVIKLDSAGNKQWTKTIEGPWGTDDEGWSIIQAKDGRYAITGQVLDGSAWPDIFVCNLDSLGNLVWAEAIGGANDYGVGESVIETIDKGYAIAGYTASYGAGEQDVYIIKLDSLGKIIWTKTVGGAGGDQGTSIIETNDKAFSIGGFTNSFGSNSIDEYLIKLDSTGNLKWTKVFGEPQYNYTYSLTQTKDGGYATVANGNSGTLFVKLDSSGGSCLSIVSGGVVGNGGIITTGGTITSSDSGRMGMGGGVTRINVGKTIVCKSTGVENSKDEQMLTEVYPNPSNGVFTIHWSVVSGQWSVEIYNVLGEKVCSKWTMDNGQLTIDLSNQPDGIYLYRLLENNNAVVGQGKLIIQK